MTKSAQPSCKNFQTVSESLEDILTSTKLGFFSLIASHVELFLVKYQTDRPMVPVLYYDLTSICCKLLELIVKPSLISDVKTSCDLMQINLSDSRSLLKISDVQIRFFALREVQCLRKYDVVCSSLLSWLLIKLNQTRRNCQSC